MKKKLVLGLATAGLIGLAMSWGDRLIVVGNSSISDSGSLINSVGFTNGLSTAAGSLVHSNTLASIPTLGPGDTYYWSSNGVAYVICSSPSSALTTNKLGP